MMDEILPVITAAVCVIAPMLTAILLVRRRMRRGEIVQVTVRRVDLDDAAPANVPLLSPSPTPFPGRGRPWRSASRPAREFCRPRRG